MSTDTPTVLERILSSTRQEVDRRKRILAPQELEERTLGADVGASRDRAERRMLQALGASGIGVVAEFKRRSPSAGVLRHDAQVAEIVRAYVRGGAIALSVLTEGPSFAGSLEDLRAARAACDLPILRKDFIVDRYQLLEARAAGADAVLLIVAALGSRELATLHDSARQLALEALVEVHDREELRIAIDSGAQMIGINNRDLRDFSVDVGRTASLIGEVPAGVRVVSESGIAAPEQLRDLQAAGVDAVLVGESLMRASDPAAALRALRVF